MKSKKTSVNNTKLSTSSIPKNVSWEEVEKVIDNEHYKKQIERLSSETLQIIAEDRAKAKEYANNTIKEKEPNNLNIEYVEIVTEGMQKFAKVILAKRVKKGK